MHSDTTITTFIINRERDLQILNLDTIQQFIVMGRLIPKPNGFITIRDLLECGIISQLKDGVKILSNVRLYPRC